MSSGLSRRAALKWLLGAGVTAAVAPSILEQAFAKPDLPNGWVSIDQLQHYAEVWRRGVSHEAERRSFMFNSGLVGIYEDCLIVVEDKP